jgi:glucosamine-6-phosphate deaminase
VSSQLTSHSQYFKSIEKVALEEGFEQILPSKVRTGNGPVPRTKVEEVTSPTILAPQPTTSRLLRATPAAEYPVRSVSPDLVPDRMASRIPEPGLNKRLTPNPEQQMLHHNAITA